MPSLGTHDPRAQQVEVAREALLEVAVDVVQVADVAQRQAAAVGQGRIAGGEQAFQGGHLGADVVEPGVDRFAAHALVDDQ